MIKDRKKAEEELAMCPYSKSEHTRPSSPGEEYAQEEPFDHEEYIGMFAILENLFDFCI